MLKLGKYIAAGMIVLSSVIANTSQAEAVVYEFTNFNPEGGEVSASGFFDINDDGNGIVDFSSELTNYQITLSSSLFPDVILTHPGSTIISDLSGVSVSDTLLDFRTAAGGSGSLCLASIGIACTVNVGEGSLFFAGDRNIARVDLTEFSFTFNPANFLVATASPPVAVPFESAPTVGILAVGGIWGFSRLRKRAAARKLDNNN